jgi:hypothetical protein
VVLCGYSVIVQLLKTFHGSVTDIGGCLGGGGAAKMTEEGSARGSKVTHASLLT